MDNKGMIGLPMRLAVTFLILAMFVPIAAGMLNEFEKGASVSAARAEADKVADAVKRTYYSGTGSRTMVDVSLMSGSYIVLGGEGSDSYSIAIMLNDSVIERSYLQKPYVKFLGEPLYVSGNRTIAIECIIDDDIYGVRVNTID